MDSKLIIVTGIPSSGKSTSSQFVTDQLQLNGIAAHWVWENALTQEFFPNFMQFMKNWEPGMEPVLLKEWEAFVQQIQAEDTTLVCDSALSLVGVYMLLSANLSKATILDIARQLAELARPVAPKVIHLVGVVDTLLQKSYVERGERWINHIVPQVESFPYQIALGRTGLPGVTQYFEDAQALMQEIIAAHGWDALTLNVTAGDWAHYEDAMLAFLGIERVVTAKFEPSVETLTQFVGDYVSADASEQFMVVLEEGKTLSLHVPGLRLGALIYQADNQFQVRAAPMQVAFGTDAEKNISHLDFTFGKNPAERFTRRGNNGG